MGHFWSALGVLPRPTFTLTVTVATTLTQPSDKYPAVKEGGMHIQHGSLTEPALAGRILTSALVPVAGATITVLEVDRHTTCDQMGAYRFDGLAFGAYTLRVHAADHQDVEKPIKYRLRGQVHNVILADP